MNPAGTLAYDVFVNDPPPQDGFLPNGEPKRFSPMASTLIYGRQDAVLTDPGMTVDQARVLGDWVAAHGRNLTRIVITHGHGDHWFAAGAPGRTIRGACRRHGGHDRADAGRPGHPPAAVGPAVPGADPPTVVPVTAVTVADDRLTLEGHELMMVGVGHGDAEDNSVLHVPDLGLVVAGDVIYNGVTCILGQSAAVGFGPWRDAIDRVEALAPRHIVCGHQDKRLDDDANRTIAETRQYLDDAEDVLRTQSTAVGYFGAKIERYPDYLGRLILWVTARAALRSAREHPDEKLAQVTLRAWLSTPGAKLGQLFTDTSQCWGGSVFGRGVAVRMVRLTDREGERAALDRLLRPVAGRTEPVTGHARRGRHRQDALLDYLANGPPAAGSCGRPGAGRDGASLRRTASALRADYGWPRSLARPPTRRAKHRIRPEQRDAARSLPGRPGGARSVGGGAE